VQTRTSIPGYGPKFDYRFFIVNEDSGTFTHHLITGVEFDLIGDLDFEIS
jgi:hypothetical protein